MNCLVGCDPEIFVKKQGVLASAYGLVAGTKEKPLPTADGAVQVDGMALEFNINPASNKKEFLNNIKSVMADLQAMVPDYELDLKASVHFDQATLDSQPEEAKELGCEPDFNAYTGLENPAPDAATTLRTAAGHVHIGWTDNAELRGAHVNSCMELVKQLDVTLGLLSVILDKDNERRQLYGKAGAFRPKPYGVEYRVLSNFWLTDDKLIDWVYDQIDFTMANMAAGKAYEPDVCDKACEIINNGDVSAAFALASELKLDLPKGYLHEV